MVNNPIRCSEISNILLNEFGHYIQPINYPTVPKGTERLRITPGPLHTDEMISDLTIHLNMHLTKQIILYTKSMHKNYKELKLAIIDKPENHPSFPEKSKIGVLLVNLGTPEGTDYWSMRKYLKQFLNG
jgi:hypothetical protein